MQIETRIASTEPEKYQFDYVLCPKNTIAMISVCLDPKVSLLEIFIPRNIGLSSPYVNVLSATGVSILRIKRGIRNDLKAAEFLHF